MDSKKLFAYINHLRQDQNILAIILFILLLGLIYRDVVFGGQTFLMENAALGTMGISGPYKYEGRQPGFVANDPSALALISETSSRFLSNSIRKGDFPLWNPYGGLAGVPFLADGQAGPLEPIQLLFSLVPRRFWPYAVDWQLLLRFFIAGFTCYLFARRQGIDFMGGIAAGALFMFCSYFMTSGNHPQVKTETLMPLVLYGYDRVIDGVDHKKWLWLCALIIGWAIVAAMPEATFFSLFLGSLWYFYKAFLIRQNNIKSLGNARIIVFKYLVPTILGVLISAAYLFPFLEFLRLSKNAHAPGAPVFLGGNAVSIGNLLGLVFPLAEYYFLNIGFLAIFALLLVLFHNKKWIEHSGTILFFSGYAVLFILAIFDLPLINWIHRLPVFDRIVFYKYPLPSVMFSLAILTGILVTKAKEGLISGKKVSEALLFSLITGVIISAGVGFENLKLLTLPKEEDKLIILSLILVTVIIVYTYRFVFQKHLWQSLFLLLVMVNPLFWSRNIHRPDRYDPYTQNIPRFINYLKNNKETFRVFGLDGLLFANISTVYGISDLRWIYALVPQRAYDFTIRFINSEGPKLIRFTGTEYPISDRMFDLLNVKYVLSKNAGTCANEKNLVQPDFLKQGLGVEQLVINNSSRMVHLADPSKPFEMKLLVSSDEPILRFSIGMSPEIFQSGRGDGVRFRVSLADGGAQTELFSKSINPSGNPCDRKWFDEALSLKKLIGQEVTVRFSADSGPNGDGAWDWAYWGDIRMDKDTKIVSPSPVYVAVHQDAAVTVYENKGALPRAFVVYQVVNVVDFQSALEYMNNPQFDPGQAAVVEDFPSELSLRINQHERSIPFTAGQAELARSGQLKVRVQTETPGLLVISEQYYPGWRAYVDGRETPIYAVDGILRGVFLNEGEHTVIFAYKPLSFSIGLTISIVSLLVTAVGLFHVYSRSRSKKSSNW